MTPEKKIRVIQVYSKECSELVLVLGAFALVGPGHAQRTPLDAALQNLVFVELRAGHSTTKTSGH